MDSEPTPTPEADTIFGAPKAAVLDRAAMVYGQQMFLVQSLQWQLEAAHERIRALEAEMAAKREDAP